MRRQLSDERKAAYYVGMGLQVLGGILFLSTFVIFAIRFGDFSNFESRVRWNVLQSICGMALLIVGGIIRSIGARGLAGSGMVLDPERARNELEPYSRMAGGMVKDALDEADVKRDVGTAEIIKIRCRACGILNQQTAKFCQACGKEL